MRVARGLTRDDHQTKGFSHHRDNKGGGQLAIVKNSFTLLSTSSENN